MINHPEAKTVLVYNPSEGTIVALNNFFDMTISKNNEVQRRWGDDIKTLGTFENRNQAEQFVHDIAQELSTADEKHLCVMEIAVDREQDDDREQTEE